MAVLVDTEYCNNCGKDQPLDDMIVLGFTPGSDESKRLFNLGCPNEWCLTHYPSKVMRTEVHIP